MRRLAILLLALLWMCLILGFHHKLSYEHATGYAQLCESAAWGALASLPLWAGFFTANRRSGWLRYLRWASAGILELEAALIMIFTWLKPVGLLPLLGGLILLWPEISRQPLQPTPKQQRQLGNARRRNWLIAAMVIPIFIWWNWFHNPLPTDEEMIQNFNEHRMELEQLVRGYRNYRRPEGTGSFFYEQAEEVKALMRAAKVSYLGVGGGGWLPAPYSAQAAKFSWGISTRSADPKVRPLLDSPADWKREMPELFEGVPPLTDRMHISHHTGRMSLRYGNPRPINRYVLRYGGITKSYFHYPYPPKIQDAHILEPYFTINGDPYTQPGERVLDSLNDFPPDWKRAECVLRRIDPNWFIAMCRAA